MDVLGRILLLTMLSLSGIPLRADPTSQPASQDLGQRDAQIRQWLSDLASPEAPIRRIARINLMSLDPNELPALRNACLKALPLDRAQLESLKEIAGHLYLAGQLKQDAADSTSGFVGVRLGIGRNDFGQGAEPVPGIVIYRRIIGFVGYRALQDGDIIIGLIEDPHVRMDRIEDFTSAVGSRGPGDEIHLRLIRAGRELTVPIRLDPKPDWARQASRVVADDPEEQPYDERVALANHFWDTSFGKGIDPDLTDYSAK